VPLVTGYPVVVVVIERGETTRGPVVERILTLGIVELVLVRVLPACPLTDFVA
jgi:Fe2+ transport system protein FeoA